MFRHYLTTALRNLARNKLYAAINIFGLAVGFAAAILVCLYVRDEFSYDAWIPGADGIQSVYTIFDESGRRPLVVDATAADFASSLKLDFPAITDVTRLQPVSHGLRNNDVEANEDIYWADANVFSILKLPVLSGDLGTALQRPDGIVMTERMARKYFGTDNAVGKTVEIDRLHPMQVTAVLKDFPSNTNLIAEVFASSRATFSELALLDAQGEGPTSGGINSKVNVLFRLRPGAKAAEIERQLPAFLERHRRLSPPGSERIKLVALTAHHLQPTEIQTMAPPSDIASVYAVGATGILIVVIAIINFVNLMTARASYRAREVGVRKAAGASRGNLILQFVGEAMLYVIFSVILALALVEWLLPILNAFLDRKIAFDYWRDPQALTVAVGLILTVGMAAGTYPAFVLSAFRPAVVLKAGPSQGGQANGMRKALVILQFAILIGLMIAGGVVYRQTQFALNEGLRLDKNQVILIAGPCHTALETNIRNLPGVRGVACASKRALNYGAMQKFATLPDGRNISLNYTSVDFGFFEFYGLRPLAGRFFSEKFGADATSDTDVDWHPPVVINESSLHLLGYTDPNRAIGKTITLYGKNGQRGSAEIVGIVVNFSLKSIRDPVAPTVYYVDQSQDRYLNVRLNGQQIPETLEAIDRVWQKSGPPLPIRRTFMSEQVERLYRDIIRQCQVFASFAGLAMLIACLGLFGLSASTTEQRTKEIGIRKSMGATTSDIMRLLLWQFAKPVLWANLIAWPVAGYAMHRWLQGFAYRIEQPLWLFIAASMLALCIAVLTVLVHAYLVARARPVTALRYE